MTKSAHVVHTPLGALTLVAQGDHLVALHWAGDPRSAQETIGEHPLLTAAARQLGEYFAGERKAFDLPLRPQGTVFQQKVWHELRRIKHGATLTYGQLAHVLGRPTAVRAVGAANGRNPLPLFIPCHRVISASGALNPPPPILPRPFTKIKFLSLIWAARMLS